MSLHYLLDGYNILKAMPGLKDLPLEEGRRAFMTWIEQIRPQGSLKNTVTVVFDGSPDVWGESGSGGPTKVIFADGSADSAIKRIVEKDSQRANCVVVTNDKDIVLYVRGLGAKVMSVGEFTKETTSFNVSSRDKQEKKYISLTRQAAINKELAKIWLKEK